jgi:hypothetical protein
VTTVRREIIAGLLAGDPTAFALATFAEEREFIRRKTIWQLEDVCRVTRPLDDLDSLVPPDARDLGG